MKMEKHFIDFLCFIIIVLGAAGTYFGLIKSQDKNVYNTQYIPAEPHGTYLLTVDGKDVLVVWQAVDGEVG